MTAQIYFRPAIPLLIALMGGILLGDASRGFGLGAAGVALAAAICIGRQIRRRKNSLIFPIVLFATLGYLSISPWIDPRFPANHIIHLTGATRWQITGQIVERPWQRHNRTRFIMHVSALADDHHTRAVVGKLRVTVVGERPAVAVGDVIRFNSRMRSITNFNNPGGFDYRRYMAFKSIWATAYVGSDRLTVIDQQPVRGMTGLIDDLRITFSKLIDPFGNGQSRAVLRALIIGDRTQVSPEMRQAFNRSGVGHLLAISGLHIGIVATVAFAFFQILTVRVKVLLWRAATRKVAALLSLVPVLIYGVVAGFSPSTQRAVIMVAVFLLAFLFESEQDPLNSLALAALLILVIDPPSLFSISFQLSFSAVLAIILGLSRFLNRGVRQKHPLKKSWYRRLQHKLVIFFLVSLLAICGSLPLVAYYFNQISLVGLVANFFVVPLIGFIVVPLGLVALFVTPFSIALASWCLQASLFVLSYALRMVTFFADLPWAAIKIITPSLLEIVCYYILGWALFYWHRSEALSVPIPQPPVGAGDENMAADSPQAQAGGRSGWQRRPFAKFFTGSRPGGSGNRAMAASVVVLVSFVMVLDTSWWLYQRFWHTNLRATIIDVGHGSASLLELPGGYTVLVDGGGFSDNSTFDVGQRIIAPFLWRKKIRTVDTLILSHPNSDHLNGLIYIARHFNVKNIWTTNESSQTRGYAKLMDVIALQDIENFKFVNLPRRQCIENVQLDILYPPPNFLELKDAQNWRNPNNNSLVLKASYKSISFLFPGDIMAEAERELVNLAGNSLSSTVLIAPHHGSKTSSSQSFLNAVAPEVVVISSRRNNRFKLPHPAVLKRYISQGCKIWRTDIHGAVQISTDGRRVAVKGFADAGWPAPHHGDLGSSAGEGVKMGKTGSPPTELLVGGLAN